MDRAQRRYSKVAVTIHWLTVVLVLYNVGLMLLAPEEVADRLIGSHMAVGLTVLFLTVLRLAWRLTHKWPPLSDQMAQWEKVLARATHVLFYVLLFVVPLAGWLMVSAGRGEPVSWFGLFDIPALPVEQSRETAGLFNNVHEIAALTTVGLVLLHVAGALKNTFSDRVPGISRMWYGRGPARR